METKKLLVVTSTFPSSNTDPVPAFVKDQIIAFKKDGPSLEISVLAPHDKRSSTKSISHHDNYNEYRFHYFWPFSAEKLAGRGIMPALKANPFNYFLVPFLFVGELIALLRLTMKEKPDMIYAHWFTPQAINARWVGTLTRTPFVFTTHAADVDVWHKIPLIGGWVVRSNVRKATAFTAVSPRSMAKLQAFFSDSEWTVLKNRAAIIPMGIDIPAIKTTRSLQKAEQKTILFVGRLAEKKGVQYLLPAFAESKKQLTDTRLIVAGDGPWLKRLQNQTKKLGIDKAVSFPGYVSGQVKQELIEQADIFVVPSIITASGDAEGLPVSLMEGLAYGKICIATNESGADGIMTDGKDGYLVPEKDVEKLSQALIQAQSLNNHSRDSLCQTAQKTAQQFSWSRIAKEYLTFLLQRSQ